MRVLVATLFGLSLVLNVVLLGVFVKPSRVADLTSAEWPQSLLRAKWKEFEHPGSDLQEQVGLDLEEQPVLPVSVPPAVEEQLARGVSVQEVITLLHGPHGTPRRRPAIRRTYDSKAFVDLLHAHAHKWPHGALGDGETNVSQILDIVEPYVIAEPAEPLTTQSNPEKIPLECNSQRYQLVLTGEARSSPAFIVDFVPVGYNLDMLEIRLLETYEYVDVFVVYEGALTHRGVKKPFYLRDSIATNPERWARFADKMLYLFGSEADLKGMDAGRWEFEKAPRYLSIAKLKVSEHPLARKIVTAGNTSANMAFAIQNDEDEIVLGHALKHLKHCELRSYETVAILPIQFKLNFEWHERSRMQDGVDTILRRVVRKWTETGVTPSEAFASEYVDVTWDAGPLVQPLHDVMFRWNTLPRTDRSNVSHLFMGPGCGIHMSSVNEPVMQLMKAVTVIDAQRTSMYPWIFELARTGNLTVEHLVWSADIWHTSRGGKHISQVAAQVRELIAMSVPWAVRYNAPRYPFLLPHAVTGTKSARCILGADVPNSQRYVWHSGGPVDSASFPAELWADTSLAHAPVGSRRALDQYMTARKTRAPFRCAGELSVSR
ncbi:hypothetical protein FVE85_5875 [Porphyridium purpureum]|uniref:Uncharacterized protein n=1 Tax=Porphyridium purpureum TaxID=35688 RepID=A0A5J4Z4Y7_PORPP|nr:hypothetical protein FVE85_5875 [Porphyridium purpureum]|eukprot:POR6983..scf295_1